MRKIMFNDRYGLTQAVLEGQKTMTRRIATALNHPNITDISEWGVDNNGNAMLLITYDTGLEKDVYPHFQIGEEVAVAQSYKDIDERSIVGYKDASCIQPGMISPIFAQQSAGWNNKMFVRADLMPFHIRITDIKAERLQDISEEDCLREGVNKDNMPSFNSAGYEIDITYYWVEGIDKNFEDPYEAFAALIDRISGRGTWERNPWVFAYEFELVK